MRILIPVLLLACVVAGVIFGALNAGLVTYDFVWTRVELPKGGALLAAVILGWLLGGLTAWWGMRSRQARERRARTRPSRKDTGDA